MKAIDKNLSKIIHVILTSKHDKENGWAVFNGDEIEVIDDMADFFDDESLPSGRISNISDAVKQVRELGFEVCIDDNTYRIVGYNSPTTYPREAVFTKLRELFETLDYISDTCDDTELTEDDIISEIRLQVNGELAELEELIIKLEKL
jgi:hypothetical protein